MSRMEEGHVRMARRQSNDWARLLIGLFLPGWSAGLTRCSVPDSRRGRRGGKKFYQEWRFSQTGTNCVKTSRSICQDKNPESGSRALFWSPSEIWCTRGKQWPTELVKCRLTNNRMYPSFLRCSGAQDTLYWIWCKDREILRRVRSANKASVLREVFVSPLCRCNKVRIKHLVRLDSYKELTLNPSSKQFPVLVQSLLNAGIAELLI